MSTTFPGSPRLTKGAIVSYDQTSPIPQVILFQYNPDSLTRSLQGQMSGNEGDPAEVFRYKGPPKETISLDIELDATDKLEHPDQNQSAVLMGVNPQLAALEMIMYPKSTTVIANNNLASQGIIEIVGPEGPFTVFIFGSKRALPVRIIDFRVTEEAYDTTLNPIRSRVSLSLQVLTYADFSVNHPGYSMFLSYQINKEFMAASATINSLSQTGVPNLRAY
jgi:hypothetical protein